MSSNGGTNTLYVNEVYDDRGKVLQNSWSTWVLPTDIEIVDISFRDSVLSVITSHGGSVCVFEIDLYSHIVDDSDEVFLDYRVALTSVDGSTVTLPTDYPYNPDTICVRGNGCEFELFEAQFTKDGSTLTFDENISNGSECTVYIGVKTLVRYIPTRPFRRTETGIVITSDRIRVARWHLSVVNTHELDMRIHSDFVTIDDQKFEGRVVGSLDNILGEKNSYTGDITFSYSQDAELAKPEFRTDGYLGLTIDGISWNGQYYKSSGRL